MIKRIILPKTYVLTDNASLIFLAGPIKGAPRWQDKGIETIHTINNQIYVVSPSNKVREEYLEDRLRGTKSDFPYQLNFERHYLKSASESKKGAIIFWLPKQREPMPINPETDFTQPYARDTRPETAGWGWKLLESNPKANVIVGGEEGFDGFDVIKRNFLAVKPDMKFYSTLEETCLEAIKLITLSK